MALYVKFMFCLACGLAAMGLVLTILLSKLFHEWDMFADLGRLLRALFVPHKAPVPVLRAEDILLDAEKRNAKHIGGTRLIDQRREQLKQLNAVEHRLNDSLVAAA